MGGRRTKRKNAAVPQADPAPAPISVIKSQEVPNRESGGDKTRTSPDPRNDDESRNPENDDDFSKQFMDDEEKAERKRLKKDRQKEKKLAKKIRAQRDESMMILLQDGTISTDTLFLSSSRRSLSSALVPEERICLLRSPLVTVEYCLNEIGCMVGDAKRRLSTAIFGDDSNEGRNIGDVMGILAFSFVMGILFGASYLWRIAEDEEAMQIKHDITWYAYWIFLGVLSSVGFGTGLHTFVLYLGPFIAKVTLAAEECLTLDFPRPPYPNQIICPSEDQEEVITAEVDELASPTVWNIMSKVRWECVAWGFGTALGELPPYFMARASRLSGSDDHSSSPDQCKCCVIRGIRQCVRNFLMAIGFWGIVLCASIPNPLFDLAGITCGHFLVPFMTFFCATVIGKSVIKSQLQAFFVILAFNENSLKSVVDFIGTIPNVGPSMQREFTEFMDYQRATVHHKKVTKSGGLLKTVSDVLVFLVIIYFVISIINGLARSYHKRVSRSAQSRKKHTSKERKQKRTVQWLKQSSSS